MSRLPALALAAVLASGTAAELGAQQLFFGRDARKLNGAKTAWIRSNVAKPNQPALARQAFAAAVGPYALGDGALNAIAMDPTCGMTGALPTARCALLPSGIALGGGVSMSIENVRPADQEWGPIVTRQSFAYTGATTGLTTEFAQGRYGTSATGLQKADEAYVRFTTVEKTGRRGANPTGQTIGAFQFDRAIQGFGFYATDANEPTSTITLRFLRGGVPVVGSTGQPMIYTLTADSWVAGDVAANGGPTSNPNAGNGNALFFGVKAFNHAFDRIEFSTANASGIDGWALARAEAVVTPEPGTWALLGTGLAALGAVVRRRRRQAA